MRQMQILRNAKKQYTHGFGGTSSKKFATITNESKNRTRTLLTRTAEKWKSTFLAKYDGEAWLTVKEEQSNTDLVASFICRICRQFEDWISLIKGFNHNWIKEGSKQLLLNAVKEHAEREPHKKAWGRLNGELRWVESYRLWRHIWRVNVSW